MSLCLNINPKSYIGNKNLLIKINKNEIDLNNIAFMDPNELFPEKWDDIIKDIDAQRKLQYSKCVGQKTDIYTCGRCKKNDCRYFEKQTRSCDEKATTFVFCQNCRNTWTN